MKDCSIDPGRIPQNAESTFAMALASEEIHYENTPIQICRKFYLQKLEIFRLKNLIFFSYSYSKQRLWYSLEPPRRGGSNEYSKSMYMRRT